MSKYFKLLVTLSLVSATTAIAEEAANTEESTNDPALVRVVTPVVAAPFRAVRSVVTNPVGSTKNVITAPFRAMRHTITSEGQDNDGNRLESAQDWSDHMRAVSGTK